MEWLLVGHESGTCGRTCVLTINAMPATWYRSACISLWQVWYTRFHNRTEIWCSAKSRQVKLTQFVAVSRPRCLCVLSKEGAIHLNVRYSERFVSNDCFQFFLYTMKSSSRRSSHHIGRIPGITRTWTVASWNQASLNILKFSFYKSLSAEEYVIMVFQNERHEDWNSSNLFVKP